MIRFLGAALTAALMLMCLPSLAQVKSVLVLSDKNTVTFRGVVTPESVLRAQIELQAKSALLKSTDVIYLVLDTPGGDVDAGQQLIDLAKALPQKVKTLTVFAASMGFHIVQNLDERLILPSGVLMSHRVRVGGLRGEIPGEALVMMQYILRDVFQMDSTVAKRMGMSLDAYQAMIRDEYWIKGHEAVQAKASDRQVVARCDQSLNGFVSIELGSFFGTPVYGTMSRCPIFQGIVDVRLGKGGTEDSRKSALESGRIYANDRSKFVKEFVVTGKVSGKQKAQ